MDRRGEIETLPPAKRPCRAEDAEAQIEDNGPQHAQRLQQTQPTRLNTIDRYTLQHITAFLDGLAIMLLNYTGDKAFTASIKAHLSSFRYEDDFTAGDDRLYEFPMPKRVLTWPRMLSDPIPMLRTLTISAINADLEKVTFAHLPKTITRLGLKHARFWGDGSDSWCTFNLPNLQHLSVVKTVLVNSTFDALTVSDWLPALLHQSTQLHHLTYLEHKWFHEDMMPIVEAIPPTLESITATRALLQKVAHWPANLHTIKWRGSEQSKSQANVMPEAVLPRSLTSLHFGASSVGDDFYRLLLLAPSTLRHLIVDSDNIHAYPVEEVSRFVQLQTLLVEPMEMPSHSTSTTVSDLSALPRSITKLSDKYAYWSALRRFLPPNARLVPFDESSANKHGDWHQPKYCDFYDDPSTFPVNLHRVELVNAPPSRPFVGLRRATCTLGGPCGNYRALINAVSSPMLTHLHLSFQKSGTFLGFVNAASLPNLIEFSVKCDSIPISLTEMYDWFVRVPKSVQTLSLNIYHSISPRINNHLVWQDDMLSPSLTSLTLGMRDYLIEFPRVLPKSLTHLVIWCDAFQPYLTDDLFEAIISPALRFVTLHTHSMVPSVQLSNDAKDKFNRKNLYAPVRQPTSVHSRRGLFIQELADVRLPLHGGLQVY